MKISAISTTGDIVYTMDSEWTGFEEGQLTPEGLVLRASPTEMVDAEMQTWYWKGEWKRKSAHPGGNYYQWNPDSESWTPNISQAKAELAALVNKTRAVKLKIGVMYNSHVYDSDQTAFDNISQSLTIINAGASLPEGFVWRTKDNIGVSFDVSDVIGLASAMFSYKNACYQKSWELKAEIDNCATVADIQALSVESGWPSNG